MKPSELRNLGPDELSQRLSALKRELLDLRLQTSVGKLEKTNRYGLVRKDIARVFTVLKEQEKRSSKVTG